MSKFDLKRIDLFVPQYRSNAKIIIVEDHPSGQPHLVVRYRKVGFNGRKEFSISIPHDWTDQDITEMLFQSSPTGRPWPAWEVPSADFASSSLFRFWKGESPIDSSEHSSSSQ